MRLSHKTLTAGLVVSGRMALLVSGVGALCIAAANSHATPETPADVRQFFPQGYVDGFGTPRPDSRERGSKQIEQAQVPHVSSDRRPSENPAQVEGPQARGGVVAGASKIPRSFAMVYVNSLDTYHFERTVREVVKLRRSGKVYIGALLHVGNYQLVTPEQEQALSRVGVSLQALPALPKYLEELTSPAWFVFSEGREAYISGEFDVGRFFTQDGELKVPKEGEELGSSEQTIDGF